mmetsp:Transcript_2901/g.7973  ORF Transcript_2901/g.7973 Transcript_2901/m.7973 type:complete len:152 (-) Transcript_2901:208-663(-)|eukprot:CAMPEP_0197188144 /NCGR_PEP_ID=MMETSP1423-20130617/17318_1 /TAXON_ID=476441 /ORGANISM="Pseudo-nitzschia heimii, Strain UNC1101" /LENGTH=151 /DNA_ID=CAMNT_0042639913 /DNA_START=54 /DNA_END=509 /DNA_ORIENTATION=+
MNTKIKNNRSKFSSIADPKLNPATAAVEKLEFYPAKGLKRVRLLSEKDEDYLHITENNGSDKYNARYGGGSFDMTSLSSIAESISNGRGQSINTENGWYGDRSSSTHFSTNYARGFYSKTNEGTDNKIVAKKQRRLVRCIAWHSELAQLDS